MSASLVDRTHSSHLVLAAAFEISIDLVAILLTCVAMSRDFGRDSVGDRRMQSIASTERAKPRLVDIGRHSLHPQSMIEQTCPIRKHRSSSKDDANTFSVAISTPCPSAVIDSQADLLQAASHHDPLVQNTKLAVDLECLQRSCGSFWRTVLANTLFVCSTAKQTCLI